MIREIEPVSDDERRLLDAIASDPKSDAPRLAYADFVAPRDPELAEYVRLACAFAAETPPGAYRAKTERLTDLERPLHARMHERGFAYVLFDRGFVESATVESDALVARADALFDRNPVLRSLRLLPANADLPALASLPHLRQITTLSVEPEKELVAWRREYAPKPGKEIDDEALAALVASPHLTSVRALSFVCAGVGPATARALARSDALAGLTSLSVDYDSRLNDEAAAALATRPCRGALDTLRIAHCALGPEGFAALAASDVVASVADVRVDACHVGDDGARAFGASPSLSSCRRLRLTDARVGDAGAAGLAGSSSLAGLEELDLTGNHVGDDGARAFAAAPRLGRLRLLDLSGNAIGEAGAEALASTWRLPSLEALGLDRNALYTDEVEEYTDWDGTVVGGGPVPVGRDELVRRYGRRFRIL